MANTDTISIDMGRRAMTWWAARCALAVIGGGAVWLLFARVLLPPARLTCSDGSIVDLELAGTPARAAAVLQGCTADDVVSAITADWVVIVAYVLVLVPLVLYLGRRSYRLKSLRFAAIGVSWSVVVAGILDVVENGSLLAGLERGDPLTVTAWATRISLVAAWVKFVLLAAAIGYLAGALAGFVVTPAPLRRLLWKPPQDQREPAATGTVGEDGWRYALCLSGGGVRSASFGLGGLQRFEIDGRCEEKHPLAWCRAREVSAVSGGSYMAAAWTIARTPVATGPATTIDGTPPWTAGSPEEKHLILRLGYLLSAEPRGVRLHTAPLRGVDASESSPTRPPTDAPGAATTLLVGVVFNIAVLLGTLWVLARPLGWLVGSCAVQPSLQVSYAGYGAPECVYTLAAAGRVLTLGEQSWLPPVVLAVAAMVTMVVWVLCGRARSLPARIGGLRRLLLRLHDTARPVATGLAVLAAVLGLLLVVLPALLVVVPREIAALGSGRPSSAIPAWFTGVVATLSSLGLVGVIAAVLRKPLLRVVPRLGGVLLALVTLTVTVLWAGDAAIAGATDDAGTYLVALGVVAVVYAANPDWWSVAPFYRGRLRQAYATFRTPSGVLSYVDGDGPAPTAATAQMRPEPSLYEYQDVEPVVKICAAMTVSDRSVLTHYGIPAHRVTFERDTVSIFVPHTDDGVYGTTRCPTRSLESLSYRWDSPRLTTMAAVAMAGAAVAPAMGRMSLGSTNALLAFANVRLGVWIPNPRYVNALAPTVAGPPHQRPSGPTLWPAYPRVRVGYLLKELFGLHDPTDLYIYVTDGGHWENTGLVDLLRDGVPDEIVCLDGSGNGVDRVTSLAEAIGLAHLECAVDIRINLDAMRARPTEPRGLDYAKRPVALGLMVPERRDAQQRVGLLWYARPVLTQSSPPTTLAYRERDAAFPATSTMDQFFDTEQFEAYRELGRHAADVIEEARQEVVTTVKQVENLTQLATHIDDRPGAWAVQELHRLVKDQNEYTTLRQRLTPT